MNLSEQFAKACVEATIPNSRMVFRQAQHVRVHDFDLYLPDGRLAALEVTSAVDPLVLSAEAAIFNERLGGQFLPRVLAKQDWFVSVLPTADVRRLRQDLDGALAAVEADGLKGFESDIDMFDYASVKRLWDDLNVEHGSVVQWDKPGIALTLNGDAVWLSIGPDPRCGRQRSAEGGQH